MDATTSTRLTVEEFARRPDPGHPEELVRGEVVARAFPGARHGQVCTSALMVIVEPIERHDLGRLLMGSGVITGRNPDSVRGPDLSFYSYDRLPRGPLGHDYGPKVPELVVEVLSFDDRWRDLHEKVAEYLAAGVTAVLVLDPDTSTAHVMHADQPTRVLGPEETLTLPDILGADFQVLVGRFFD